jgi:hypothetical protein
MMVLEFVVHSLGGGLQIQLQVNSYIDSGLIQVRKGFIGFTGRPFGQLVAQTSSPSDPDREEYCYTIILR